jgi:site-specific DNA recombinase
MSYKVGIYCRKSSGVKEENISINKQIELGKSFCSNNNLEFEIYSEVISGKSLFREEWNRMMKDILEKKINGIWVYMFDRLSRSLDSLIEFRNVFKESNFDLYVGSVKYDMNDFNNNFFISYNILNSELEGSNISYRMSVGKKMKLEKGKFVSGNVGYGYKRINGDIFINEDESKWVKEIYKVFLYKNVKSYNDVFNRLKNNKRKKLNDRIGLSLIIKILNNRRYVGNMKSIYGGVEYEFFYDKIIDEDVYDLVSDKIKMLKGLRKGNLKSENEYILKGKVKCGSCNNNMWIIGSKSKVKDGFKYYRFFSCNDRIKKLKSVWNNNEYSESCDSIRRNKIRVDKLENVVWNILFDVLLNSNKIFDEYKMKYNDDRLKYKEYKSKISYYKSKINSDKKKFIKMVELLVENGIDEIDEDVKLKYNREKINDEKRINDLEILIDKLDKLDDDKVIKERIKDDLKVIYEDDSKKNKIRFLDKYVESVFVKRLNNDINDLKYDINVVFKFDEDINNEDLKGKVIRDDNNKMVYILNSGIMEIEDLIYKENIRLIDICFNICFNKKFGVKYVNYSIVN